MAKAYINWGRWVVDCECKSAHLVGHFPAEVQCKACGALVQVEYPPDRRAIEAVLARRPPVKAGSQYVHNHRNWYLGENIADLRRENREHGLPDRMAP